jgi:DNA-binding winged helix-turn-helix (wHTH) protein
MHVCRIRKKLRDAGASSLRLETVYGRGYLLSLGMPDDRSAARTPPQLACPA